MIRRRIPEKVTEAWRVRVNSGPYQGAVGELGNWYEKDGLYEVYFDQAPSPSLRDMELFNPEILDFVEVISPPSVSASSGEDVEPSNASSEDSPAGNSGRYAANQWLALTRAVNGRPAGTRFQVEESLDDGVEVAVDSNHLYGLRYSYADVAPVSPTPPGTMKSLATPAQPASLPALAAGQSGNLPFMKHPDRQAMATALTSHGFEIDYSDNRPDQQTQVIRYQEPYRSAVGKRVVEIGPKTTYTDVEHEFSHVLQQTRWAMTPGVGYLPTKTEQVHSGTLAEGRANPDDREMDDSCERALGEVEAYGEELVRLHGRHEVQTGDLTLPELARGRFLRWLGDYLWRTNGDPATAKNNFKLAEEWHYKLFPDLERKVREAMNVAGMVLGANFVVPKSEIDRR